MKIKFVSHASVIVTTTDAMIWSDPWLIGKTFNDSWSLFPEPHFEIDWFKNITHLWISHEHPDHFNMLTLKSLPEDFKQKVIILFQANNSDKVSVALKKMGYKNIVRLPHAKFINLTKSTRVWCYQVGQMDSIFAVQNQDKTVLNLNDAEVNTADCQFIAKTFKNIDVLLNQFSIAGYNGYSNYEKRLPVIAQSLLEKVYNVHSTLKSKMTIPFANMMYFSTTDNQYINQYVNSPRKVYDYFKLKNKEHEVAILFPGEEYILGEQYSSECSLDKYDKKFQELPKLSYTHSPIISFDVLTENFMHLYEVINQRFYKFIIKLFLKPMKIYIPDLEMTVLFDLIRGKFVRCLDKKHDLIILSQPFSYAMKFDWGFQTLGVSGRHRVVNNYSNYRWHRILFSLNNAEIWLKFHLFLNKRNFNWFIYRFNGLFQQVKNRFLSQTR